MKTFVVSLVLWATPLQAQVLDPTTYAPAISFYYSTRYDWRSSQIFFEHGWLEQNPEFTISGQRDDLPISYSKGMGKIRGYTLIILGNSVVHNVGSTLLEKHLTRRNPEKKGVLRAIFITERIAFASLLIWQTSRPHIQQGQRNDRLARERGWK